MKTGDSGLLLGDSGDMGAGVYDSEFLLLGAGMGGVTGSEFLGDSYKIINKIDQASQKRRGRRPSTNNSKSQKECVSHIPKKANTMIKPNIITQPNLIRTTIIIKATHNRKNQTKNKP